MQQVKVRLGGGISLAVKRIELFGIFFKFFNSYNIRIDKTHRRNQLLTKTRIPIISGKKIIDQLRIEIFI